jgi:tetratricopeptide (TPR) repeat protein
MKTFQIIRAFVFVLTIAASCLADAQTYISAPRYDSLGTRYDSTLSLVRRCEITSDHCWACFNLGKVEENWQCARELLDLAERVGADTMMAQAYFQLCDAALGAGDPSASLQYGYLSRDYSQRTGDTNNAAKAEKEIAINYKMLGDDQRALVLLRGALQRMTAPHQLTRTYAHLSECYLHLGNIDSALFAAQRSNTIIDPATDPFGAARSLIAIGQVYEAKGDVALADVHYQRAIAIADSFQVVRALSQALTLRGSMFLRNGNAHQAVIQARLALQAVPPGSHADRRIDAANLLRQAFEAEGLIDSAYRYSKLSVALNDSLRSAANISRIQNLSLQEELKAREDSRLREEAAITRTNNIQFGIIALIVITLAIFLLVFSRTAVVGAKAIKNLSLIALLLFFEFINLLLHPLLDRVTGHSPILMLLAMAAIAGLLIPLHHRMEHWITNMLVSKNNRVRLEAARRTIEELEARPSETNAG